MRECFNKQNTGEAPVSVSLDFQARSKSRGKAKARDDLDVAWFL